MMKSSNEQKYFDALKQIASYMTTSQIRKASITNYGIDYEEGLEIAYENVVNTAKATIKGKPRPKE